MKQESIFRIRFMTRTLKYKCPVDTRGSSVRFHAFLEIILDAKSTSRYNRLNDTEKGTS